MAALLGSGIRRRQDPRLITGQGQFVDDIKPYGLKYAGLVRSPHAHARIKRVNTSAAGFRP